MIAKILILLALVAILASLGSALYYLVRDPENSRRSAKALTTRISISIALFIFLLVAFANGWIKPHGLPEAPTGQAAEK